MMEDDVATVLLMLMITALLFYSRLESESSVFFTFRVRVLFSPKAWARSPSCSPSEGV